MRIDIDPRLEIDDELARQLREDRLPGPPAPPFPPPRRERPTHPVRAPGSRRRGTPSGQQGEGHRARRGPPARWFRMRRGPPGLSGRLRRWLPRLMLAAMLWELLREVARWHP